VLYRQYRVACDQMKAQITAGLWCKVLIHTLYCVNGRLSVTVFQLLYCAVVRGYVLYRQYRVACDQRKVQLTASLWCNVPIHTLYFLNCKCCMISYVVMCYSERICVEPSLEVGL